jgi:predicted O-methyltransferase YrrM
VASTATTARTRRRHDDPLLQDLALEAERQSVSVVGPVVGELLLVLAAAAGAPSILELGTATGYAAIFLALPAPYTRAT